jgi:molybdate transport system permease protein
MASWLTFSQIEQDALRVSLGVALRAVLFSLPVAIFFAWILARKKFPGKFLLDGLMHVPLILPPVVVGFLLLVVFGARGPVGAWLKNQFGVSLAFTAAGAALATAVMVFPLMVRAIRLAFDAVDPGLEQAARTLGATPFYCFRTVTLPLIWPGILSGAVIAFAASFGEFGAVITFASNIQGETQTLPLAIYTALQSPGGDEIATRLAIISLLVAMSGLIVSEWITRRYQRRLTS